MLLTTLKNLSSSPNTRLFSKMNQTPIIGILGGVGPMAGVVLQNYIIMNTNATKDQDHLTVIHTCDAQNITDQTDYLISLSDSTKPKIPNPGLHMAQVAINSSQHSKLFGKPCVLGVPCNSFHSPPIFEVFEKEVNAWNSLNNNKGESGDIRILNMINLTVDYIVSKGYKTVGLMSTTGTRNQKLYRDPLEAA